MPMRVAYTVVNGQIIAENRGGVKRDYIPDALGNTIALMDSSGNLTDAFDYFPSGTVASRTGTTPTPFQWNGRSGYYQNSANRVYVRARNFYTNLGRWTTQDPIGFKGGDYNLYAYVWNKIVTWADPTGLSCSSPTCDLCPQWHNHYWSKCDKTWNICLTKCGGINNIAHCCEKQGISIPPKKNDPNWDCKCISPVPPGNRPLA